MSPYDHPVQKANRARPIVIADGEINPAMWNPKLTIVRQSKVRAAHPYRLRAIVDSIQLSDGCIDGIAAVRGGAEIAFTWEYTSAEKWKAERVGASGKATCLASNAKQNDPLILPVDVAARCRSTLDVKLLRGWQDEKHADR